jgi:hypothetical protein
MSRGRWSFRQSELTRAVRAVRNAGVEVMRVEVDRAGKIVVVAGKPDENQAPEGEANEWDRI